MSRRSLWCIEQGYFDNIDAIFTLTTPPRMNKIEPPHWVSFGYIGSYAEGFEALSEIVDINGLREWSWDSAVTMELHIDSPSDAVKSFYQAIGKEHGYVRT